MSRNFEVAQRMVVAGLLFVALFAGCYSQSPDQLTDAGEQPAQASSTSIAVIDLDRVALGIGAVDKIREALGRLEQKCLTELRQSTSAMFGEHTPSGNDLAEFDASTAPLVGNLSVEQQREFAKSLRAAQAQILSREQKLRDDFLNEVRPYAYQIARQQGCQLVLTTDQVYVATEQVDITPEVIRTICEINAQAAVPVGRADELSKPVPKMASGGSFKLN
jgi:Skp family chaperone for outer membrane proteins